MTTRAQVCLAGAATCLLAAWNARELPSAWWHSPYDRFGWAAALVWIVPLALGAGRRRPVPALFFAGLLCSALGAMAELNVLAYAGLALACSGFLLSEAAALPWLLTSVSWMPLFGWLAASIGTGPTHAARVLLAVAGVIFYLCRSRG